MSRIISATVGPLAAASANSIATSQSGVANTALTLTAAPVVLDSPRRIGITSAGNDTGKNFTIVGTDWNGYPATEVLAGTNALTAQSLYDYATVISITPSANTTSTVTVGTTAVASSRPIFLDTYGFGTVAIQVNTTGGTTYTVQQSLDNPNSIGYTNVTWINSADANVVNASISQQSNYAYAPAIARVLVTAGTGPVTIELIQHATPSI